MNWAPAPRRPIATPRPAWTSCAPPDLNAAVTLCIAIANLSSMWGKSLLEVSFHDEMIRPKNLRVVELSEFLPGGIMDAEARRKARDRRMSHIPENTSATEIATDAAGVQEAHKVAGSRMSHVPDDVTTPVVATGTRAERERRKARNLRMSHINPETAPAPVSPTGAQAARNRRNARDSGMSHVNPNHAVAPAIATGMELTQINKFHTKGGTGFAAEEANILADRLRGRSVDAIGTSNTLNGPDRVVDGVAIQTKYYDSASRTLESAFNREGVYRYNGQRLEVPADQYEACLERMRAKISAGRVPGVTDPAQAEEIVKKGNVTYAQARNIARAGTIDGLKFDAKTHAVGAGLAVGLSFAIHYAQLKWNGVETEPALKEAALNGLGSGTLAFTAGIATSQVLRTRAAAVGVVVAKNSVKSIQSTRIGKVVIEKIAAASLGKSVYGAAARNHVAKLLRSNVVTSVVVTAVMTAPDVYRASFAKSISWKQLGKNLAVNSTSIAAGSGGWFAGAAAGASVGSVVPGVGTAVGGVIGGIVGSFAGGSLASIASKKAMDLVVDDDSVKLMPLIQEQLSLLAYEYMLSQEEMGVFVEYVSKNVRTGFLRDLYAAKDRSAFIRSAFEPKCEELASARAPVRLPDASAIDVAVAEILEEALEGSLEPCPT